MAPQPPLPHAIMTKPPSLRLRLPSSNSWPGCSASGSPGSFAGDQHCSPSLGGSHSSQHGSSSHSAGLSLMAYRPCGHQTRTAATWPVRNRASHPMVLVLALVVLTAVATLLTLTSQLGPPRTRSYHSTSQPHRQSWETSAGQGWLAGRAASSHRRVLELNTSSARR